MKGDYVRFVEPSGKEHELEIRTSGRRVELTYPVKSKVVWAAATEYTRGGQPTGYQILARVEGLVRIEAKIEPRNVKPKARKVVNGAV